MPSAARPKPAATGENAADALNVGRDHHSRGSFGVWATHAFPASASNFT
jgi:hypothetical protein